MGLYKKLDFWSLTDELDEIMEGNVNRCFEGSEYAGFYDELLTELANAAGDFWVDTEEIKSEIAWKRNIPYKVRKCATEDDETETAAFWFNTVALMLTETDAGQLFYREENFEDIGTERAKRLRMLERLSKSDLLWIVTTVSNFLIRYIDIAGAWEAIKGTIDELDSRQAFIKDGGSLREPKAAYL